MKLAVVTRADENWADITDLTHPIMRDYARGVNADFIILSELWEGCARNISKYHFRILNQYEMFDTYDRILHLDSDITISPNCPNIFDVVPEDKIGTVFEDVGTRIASRRQRIADIQRSWGNINWSMGYINTGVFMTSRCHKEIFRPYGGVVWEGEGEDDVHIGYMINKLQLPIYQLNYKFNNMTMFSEEWNGSPDRLESHIIHYAGGGIFRNVDDPVDSKLDQVKMDISILW